MQNIDDLLDEIESLPSASVQRGRDYKGTGQDIWRKSFIYFRHRNTCYVRITFLNNEVYYVKTYQSSPFTDSILMRIERYENRNEEIDDALGEFNLPPKHINCKSITDIEIHQEEKVMESHQIVNSLYENLKVVQVVFEQGPTSKHYSYKTFLDLQPDDRCVVDVNGALKVVKVVGNSTRDLECMNLKWIVQKVDTTEYERLIQVEEEATQKVHEMIMEQRRRETANKLKDFL